MDRFLNLTSDGKPNINVKENNHLNHTRVGFKIPDFLNKKDHALKTKMSFQSSNIKSKGGPSKVNSFLKDPYQSIKKPSKSNLNTYNYNYNFQPSKSSLNVKNNLVTKTFITKAKIMKTKSNYDSTNNFNPHRKLKYTQTKNNFLKLITKSNKGYTSNIKEYNDSKYSLLYNHNFLDVLDGEALTSVEKSLQNKILDMGKEAEFMEFEIGPLDISINKYNIKKKKPRLAVKKTKDYERKRFEKNKKFLKTAIHKKNILSQISASNSNNLNSENYIIKSNQNLDDSSSKIFLNNENKKKSSSNQPNLSSKLKYSSTNKKKSRTESGVVTSKNKNNSNNSNVNSKKNISFRGAMGLAKTNTPSFDFPKKETVISKSKTYSNIDSRIGQTIIYTPYTFERNISASSDKELIVINKEKFRNLSHKKLIYDSLDDEELVEDAIFDNFYLMPNSQLVIIIDAMVLIFSFWSMVYKPLSLVLNNCDLKNTITSITFDNITNLFIDILFIFDLLINFFKAYYNFDEQLITKSNKIFFHYIKGYFFIDLISAVPYYSIFKFIALLRYIKHGITVNCSNYYNHQIHDLFQVLELLKLFKIIKCISKTNIVTNFIINELNVYTFFENWSSIIFNIVLFFLVLHLTACMHIFISCTAYPNWIISNNLDLSSFRTIYLSSIYFLITTVTSVGYGDIIGQSFTEFCFEIVLLIVGILAYSWLISSISNYVKENNKQTEIFNQKLSMLKEIKLEHPNMTKELYDKIYLHLEYINLKQKKDKSALLDSLPHTVKKTLLYEMYRPLIDNFNFFKNFKNSEFINRVISKLKPIIGVKNDLLLDQGEIIEETFFVKQGRLSLEVKIDTIHPELSVQKLLNEEYFFGVENNELYQKNAFGLVNITASIKPNMDHTTIINKKNLYDLYSRKNVAQANLNQKDIKSIMTNDQGKNEIKKHQNLSPNFIYLKILDIRKNEHFGALLMFLNKRSPLSLRVKTKKAELFFLKKIDAIEISSSYPNIWKRVNKASFHNLKQIKNIMRKIIKHYCETYGINFMKTICEENNIKDIDELKKIYTLQTKNPKEYYNSSFSLLNSTNNNQLPQRLSAIISKPQMKMLEEFMNNNGILGSKPYEEMRIMQPEVKDLDMEINNINEKDKNTSKEKKLNSSFDSPENCTLIKIKNKENNSKKEQTYLIVNDNNSKKKNSLQNKNILSEESKETKTRDELNPKNNKIKYGKEETKQLFKNFGTPYYPKDINDEIYPEEMQKVGNNTNYNYNENNDEVEYMPMNHLLSSQDSIKNNYIQTIKDNYDHIITHSKKDQNKVTINNNFITNNVINNINPTKLNHNLTVFHFGFNYKSVKDESMENFKKNNINNNKIYNLAIFQNSFELSAFKNEEKIDIDLNNVPKGSEQNNNNNKIILGSNKVKDKRIYSDSFDSSSSKSKSFSSSISSGSSPSSYISKEKEIKKEKTFSKKESPKKIINLSSSSSSKSTIKQHYNKGFIIYRNQGLNINAEYFNLNQLTNGTFSKIKKLQNYIKNILLKKLAKINYSKIELPKVKNIIKQDSSSKIVPLSPKKISKKFSIHAPFNNNNNSNSNISKLEKFKNSLAKNQKSNLFSSELNDKGKNTGISKKKLNKNNNINNINNINNNNMLLNYVNRNIRDDSAVLNNPGKFYNGLFNNIMKRYVTRAIIKPTKNEKG